LRAAADGARLRMVAICAEGELTVSEITEILGMTQPAVSRHLKILAEAGLLIRFREGAWAYFRLADEGKAADVARWLVDACDDDDELRRRDLERLADIRARRLAEAQAYFAANVHAWGSIRSLHVDDASVEERLIAMAPKTGVSNLLDVGVGGGRILELLGARAERAAGLDINYAMLTVARGRIAAAGLRHCSLRHGDLYAAPFDDARFDLITAHLVLHYLDNPGRAIKEIGRLLQPGGQALIADFAPHDLTELREKHAHRRLGFATDDMRRWFADAGLEFAEEAQLAGDPLTVCIWRAVKPDGRAVSAAA
jgi:ubiquinone/menaquinone biosynthesis C-methylase UbiE/DNA-binding transcriptional ArsR family regulator